MSHYRTNFGLAFIYLLYYATYIRISTVNYIQGSHASVLAPRHHLFIYTLFNYGSPVSRFAASASLTVVSPPFLHLISSLQNKISSIKYVHLYWMQSQMRNKQRSCNLDLWLERGFAGQQSKRKNIECRPFEIMPTLEC